MICECNEEMIERDTNKSQINFSCPSCGTQVAKIMRAPSRILNLSKRFDKKEIEAQEFIIEVIEALEDSRLATAGWHRDEE